MKKKIIPAALIVFSLFSLQLRAEMMRIAVMDFKAEGVSKSLAKNVTELVRSEMINSDKYIIIERSQMDQIFKKQGLQRAGCTDITCAVKAGKLLSAKKILIGNVMKIGSKFVITGRIVDVKQGIALFSDKQSVRSEDELVGAAARFSQKIAGKIGRNKAFVSEGTGSFGEAQYNHPAIAGITSVFPFWSGSWNARFNLLGLGFVGLKCGMIVSILYTLQHYNDRISDLETEKDKHTSAIFSSTNNITAMIEQSSTDTKINDVESKRNNFLFGEAVLLVAFTAFDIVHSILYVRHHNRTANYSTNTKQNSPNLEFTIAPRIYTYNGSQNSTYKADGIDFALTYRF